jgi:hypothetical protein
MSKTLQLIKQKEYLRKIRQEAMQNIKLINKSDLNDQATNKLVEINLKKIEYVGVVFRLVQKALINQQGARNDRA